MRPLDHKLKYQIDKLVRTAVTGSLGKTEVIRFSELCSLKKALTERMRIRFNAQQDLHLSTYGRRNRV